MHVNGCKWFVMAVNGWLTIKDVGLECFNDPQNRDTSPIQYEQIAFWDPQMSKCNTSRWGFIWVVFIFCWEG